MNMYSVKKYQGSVLLLLLSLSLICGAQEGGKKNQPSNLSEAHAFLEKMLTKEQLRLIDAMKSESEMQIFQGFNMDLWIRNNWGLLEDDSELVKDMKKLSFTHPDDMSAVILNTYWCKRHNLKFKLKQRAKYYKSFWTESALPPVTAVDPKDKSSIEWVVSMDAEGRLNRVIHIGRSKKTRRWLAYEHTIGIYVPTSKIIKQVEENLESDKIFR